MALYPCLFGGGSTPPTPTGKPYIYSAGAYGTVSAITGNMVYGAEIEFVQLLASGNYQNIWCLGSDNFNAYNNNTSISSMTIRVRTTAYYVAPSLTSINRLVVKNGDINFNGNSIGTYTSGSTLSTNASANLKLFCNNSGGYVANGVCLFTFKLFDASGNLIFDFKPEATNGLQPGKIYDNVSQNYIGMTGKPIYSVLNQS